MASKAQVNARTRKRYRAARAKGLCGECKKRPAMDGKSRCAECNESRKPRINAYQKRRRLAFKALGFCVRCLNNKAMAGKTICGRCSELDTDNARLRRRRKAELRLTS